MFRKIIAMWVLLMFVAVVPVSFAGLPICEEGLPDGYGQAAGVKLTRGLYNTVFGWSEVVDHIANDENKAQAVAKGLIDTVVRMGTGLAEAVTFFVPMVEIPARDPVCPFQS